MKQEFLKHIAYSRIEIKSYHTIEKMNRIEQIEYNFLPKLVIDKLLLKVNIMKRVTNKDYFIQTDAIDKLEKKLIEANKKAA